MLTVADYAPLPRLSAILAFLDGMDTNPKNIRRRDATGHLDPNYARELLEKARENQTEDGKEESTHAFISRSKTGEELAEELGEAAMETATSGQDSETLHHEEVTDAEVGGPYVTTTEHEEFAEGTDESNIPEATREPFPKPSSAES